jgi:hypothetical protein
MENRTMEPKTVVQTTGRPLAGHAEQRFRQGPQVAERRAGRVNFVEIHRRYPATGPWNVDIVRLQEQGGRW